MDSALYKSGLSSCIQIHPIRNFTISGQNDNVFRLMELLTLNVMNNNNIELRNSNDIVCIFCNVILQKKNKNNL